MKSLVVAAIGLFSCCVSAHSMQPVIKEYVISEVSIHKVMLMNSSNNPECYNVFVDDSPAMNPKVCLGSKKREYISVLVRTPPNEKKVTKVCTENSKNENKSQRIQLCTHIVTYYPQQQLQSAQ